MAQRSAHSAHEQRTIPSPDGARSQDPSMQSTMLAPGGAGSEDPSMQSTVLAPGGERPRDETTARATVGALDSTIEAPPKDPSTPPTSSERLDRLVERLPSVPLDAYHRGEQVARGGMGCVSRARDERLDRPVAIKELLVWSTSQEKRFVREALLTARLQHPAVVPVYEAGRWPNGEPFYAMKLVSGRTLSDLIDECAKSGGLAARLSLLPHVLTVAQAIAYAHSQRILHRDLKPANVLVGEFGETFVIDWGLAKGLGEDDDRGRQDGPSAANEGLTMAGTVMGTPAYMPPEQATGSEVDERSDIYAIGAMLYHLIAAVPPYHHVPWEKLLQTIVAEPPRSLLDYEPTISDELLAIVNKAMARGPTERYPTAKALADDLHRYQSGQIVAAHTYSSAQLLRRFWRRNRAALSITGGALSLITLVVIGAFIKTDAERRFALQKEREATAASRVAETERTAAYVARNEAITRADEMTLFQAQEALSRDPNEALAWLKTLSPSFTDAEGVRRIAADARARGISRTFRGHTALINDSAAIDGGRRFLTSSDDKTIRVWDAATGESRAFVGHTDEAWHLTVMPGGATFASTSKDSTVRVWDINTGATLRLLKAPSPVDTLVVRGDGALVGVAWGRGPVYVWAPGSSEAQALGGSPAGFWRSSITDDGTRAVFLYKDGARALIDTITGDRRSLPRISRKEARSWISKSGRWIYSRWYDASSEHLVLEIQDVDGPTTRTIKLGPQGSHFEDSHRGEIGAVVRSDAVEVYSLKSAALLRRIPVVSLRRAHADFSPDDQLLVVGGYDRVVRLWDVTTGESSAHAGLKGFPSSFAFVPEKRSVFATSAFGDSRLFEAPKDGAIVTNHGVKSAGIAAASDGSAASLDEKGRLRITDPKGSVIAEHELPKATRMTLIRSPDQRRFAGVSLPRSGDSMVASGAQEIAEGPLIFGGFDASKPVIVRMASQTRALAWHPSAESVFVGLRDGAVLKVAMDGSIAEVARVSTPIDGLAVSEDGVNLAIGDDDGLVHLLQLETGAMRDLGRHTAGVSALSFSKTGAWLASGSRDHTVRLWRLPDGSSRLFDASGYGVIDVKLSKDERTLFVLNVSETFLRRWDVESGEPLSPFTGHEGAILRFSLSADGRRLLSSSLDRTARVFDIDTGKSRALVDPSAAVVASEFTLGDKLIMTLSATGAVRAFSDDLPETMPELRAFIEGATPDRIGAR